MKQISVFLVTMALVFVQNGYAENDNLEEFSSLAGFDLFSLGEEESEQEMISTTDQDEEVVMQESGEEWVEDLEEMDTLAKGSEVDDIDQIVMENSSLQTSEEDLDELPLEEGLPSFEMRQIDSNSESLQEDMNSIPETKERPILLKNEEEFSRKETIPLSLSEIPPVIEIDLMQIFRGAPIIYTSLLALSIISFCIWFYSLLTIRSSQFLPRNLIRDLRGKLISNQFTEALDLCTKEKHFFCKILASGIITRRHGIQTMFEAMKAEGKRETIAFWQRIALLNDIAIIAPMLGLLGTVVGMFYTFYDLNRSIESVSVLFDGLGISVGTTVAGLIVAIMAMILHSVVKYRLVKLLAQLENETHSFAALIDTNGPKYLGT